MYFDIDRCVRLVYVSFSIKLLVDPVITLFQFCVSPNARFEVSGHFSEISQTRDVLGHFQPKEVDCLSLKRSNFMEETL